MKNYFNEKQLNELRPYEHHFYTATKENYKRATPSTLNDKIADLYQEVTGNKLNRNWTCGTCVLNAFKAVGELYYQSLEALKVSKEPEPSPVKAEPEKTVANDENKPKPKKAGRPKSKK